MTVMNMNCVDGMKLFPDAYFDSIVTDPPYELGFMGKAWDASGIANNVAMWREALRVLKPGGHLLAFSGSRTYHRMVCAIEDAGFEIRDQIMWVYGSGFPKSLDVSKAIDKAAGAERETIKVKPRPATSGTMAGSSESRPWIEKSRELGYHEVAGDVPATDAARQWQGWGTALKPAHEPIVVARKPLIGTVAANVLAHGTGALNIDGCRVEGGDTPVPFGNSTQAEGWRLNKRETDWKPSDIGRWPANLIHDGSDEVLAAFPQAPGQQGDLKDQDHAVPAGNAFGQYGPKSAHIARADSTASAARFFYCAKTSRSDRSAHNTHPTVKPTDLMRYLCRLVTPPGGLVLDPFTGSGSTWKAAKLEGFRFIGFELSAEYCDIAMKRIMELNA